MNLPALILASIMITGSMHAMENQALVQNNQLSHSMTSDNSMKEQIKHFKQTSEDLRVSIASRRRKESCIACATLICCCPCIAVKCLLSAICPRIVIVNQSNQNNNNQ